MGSCWLGREGEGRGGGGDWIVWGYLPHDEFFRVFPPLTPICESLMEPRCHRIWIAPLIVFNISFLWGFFSLLSFILSAGWVNSLPVTARRPSSFKSTDKHRPQTGRREVTSYLFCSSFSEAALCQCWVGADYTTVRRAIIKVFAGPAPPYASELLQFAVSKCWTGQFLFYFNQKLEPEMFRFPLFPKSHSDALFIFPSIWCPCTHWQDGSTEMKTTHHA